MGWAELCLPATPQRSDFVGEAQDPRTATGSSEKLTGWLGFGLVWVGLGLVGLG